MATRGGRPGAAALPALAALALLLIAPGACADFQGSTHLMPFDEDTINYSKTPARGPIEQLQAQIDAGQLRLEHDPDRGYLTSLLQALNISRASQMLVFSKTSFQRERISPRTPRALYFNDHVYIGYIPGSPMLEISAADPKLGGVFYTLDQARVERPTFVRTDQCLECHASSKTMGVPGHLVRSFATDDNGVVDLLSGASLVNHRTPLSERWGGWYVTGRHGSQTHRGNLAGKAAFAREQTEPNHLGNLDHLGRFLDPGPYPAPTSDIVALMVLEHQAHMHNFLTRLQYESTLALRTYGHINYLRNIVEAFLKYLLFVEETPLTAPIRGSAEYVRWFTALGPRDPQGRSLREFDLQTRLFKYPCSHLIYSPAFDALPDILRQRIYARLREILTGEDDRPEYRRLTPPLRRAILEILRDTKPGLPPDWKEAEPAGPR